MRELLAQDGHRRANAFENRHGEGGADGQAVDEVVEAVAQRDHPGQGADVRVADAFQPVAGALGSLQVLQEIPAPRPPGQRDGGRWTCKGGPGHQAITAYRPPPQQQAAH